MFLSLQNQKGRNFVRGVSFCSLLEIWRNPPGNTEKHLRPLPPHFLLQVPVPNWLEKVVPHALTNQSKHDAFQPIRSETETNRDLTRACFPRFARVARVYLELWLVHMGYLRVLWLARCNNFGFGFTTVSLLENRYILKIKQVLVMKMKYKG